MDPAVYGLLLKSPVGADLKSGQLARFGMFINSYGLHPEVIGQLLDREDISLRHVTHRL